MPGGIHHQEALAAKPLHPACDPRQGPYPRGIPAHKTVKEEGLADVGDPHHPETQVPMGRLVA
jgi:hypothetical protein